MLQTGILLKGIPPQGYPCFKSPRECYKPQTRYWEGYSLESFKSPRECYKLVWYRNSLPHLPVSSPQGNATNIFPTRHTYAVPHGFKSPRECYKPFLTMIFSSLHAGFKSPRECYKLFVVRRGWEKMKKFQVPKGMLQTLDREYRTRLHIWFQVPKGMLQTETAYQSVSILNGFKSPRECYKRSIMGFHSYYYLCFKSPRECYKHLQSKIEKPLNFSFQVPKGMLQTFAK